MKPRILFLSNPFNDGTEEDELLVKFLSADLDLVVCHPTECFDYLPTVEGVIIRNIWPTHEFQSTWNHVKERLRGTELFIYNPLTFRGDIEGKDYLSKLHEMGFPVIPSVDSISRLNQLPQTEQYWIKPKFSCDGFGAERLSKLELLARAPRDFIIQPFMEFEYEPSFFFVDNTFQHAIKQKHRLLSPDTEPYVATRSEIEFAQQFVTWAGMPFGIQRIDAIRTGNGQLFLTEIENLCPYLYLLELESATQVSFLAKLRESVLCAFLRNRKAHVDHVLLAD